MYKNGKIALASDHGGFGLKGQIADYLRENGVKFVDFGTDSRESCDYPDYAEKACTTVVSGDCDCAILVCGTGIGMSIAANKVQGAYAALLTDVYSAPRAVLSNDSNIACLGAFTIGTKLAEELLKTWLGCRFEPGCASQVKVDRYKTYDQER